MNETEAKNLTISLINKTFLIHGKQVCARDLGYSFEWMSKRSHNTLGQCHYGTKKIRLSPNYVQNNDVTLVEDTIRHELAHAFSHHIFGRKGWGHNYYWKSVCVQVGANPQRCKSEMDGLVVSGHKYVLRNKETLEVYDRYHRNPKKLSFRCRMGTVWLRGKKNETKGKLEVVPV